MKTYLAASWLLHVDLATPPTEMFALVNVKSFDQRKCLLVTTISERRYVGVILLIDGDNIWCHLIDYVDETEFHHSTKLDRIHSDSAAEFVSSRVWMKALWSTVVTCWAHAPWSNCFPEGISRTVLSKVCFLQHYGGFKGRVLGGGNSKR